MSLSLMVVVVVVVGGSHGTVWHSPGVVRGTHGTVPGTSLVVVVVGATLTALATCS